MDFKHWIWVSVGFFWVVLFVWDVRQAAKQRRIREETFRRQREETRRQWDQQVSALRAQLDVLFKSLDQHWKEEVNWKHDGF